MTNYNERLDEILMAYKRYPYGTSAAPHISGDEAKQALLALMNEARADEISTIPLEHGNRTTCTYVNGEQQTIESRYDELRTKVAEWESKEQL